MQADQLTEEQRQELAYLRNMPLLGNKKNESE
jgi:hypothetical protein